LFLDLPAMGHKKLIRFEAIKTFPNVLEFPENIAGNWHQHFNNNNPVVLELACGKGEYTVGLARMFAEKTALVLILKETESGRVQPRHYRKIYQMLLS